MARDAECSYTHLMVEISSLIGGVNLIGSSKNKQDMAPSWGTNEDSPVISSSNQAYEPNTSSKASHV